MDLALSAATFGPSWSTDALLRQAAVIGTSGVELVLEERSPLTFESTEPQCRQLAAQVKESKLRLAAVAMLLAPGSLASEGASTRKLIGAALRRTGWLGAPCLCLLPAASADESSRPAGSPDYACQQAREALLELRHEAEDCGVVLGLACFGLGLSNSPTELREFLDELITPWIGACLNLDDPGATTQVSDWIRTLAPRIQSVRISASAQAPDPVAVVSSLSGIAYSGSCVLVATGARDLKQWIERLRAAGMQPHNFATKSPIDDLATND